MLLQAAFAQKSSAACVRVCADVLMMRLLDCLQDLLIIMIRDACRRSKGRRGELMSPAVVTSGHVKSLPDFPGFLFFRMQRGLCEISNFRASYCSSTRAVPQYRYISICHKQLKFRRRWGLFSAVRSLPLPRLGLPRPRPLDDGVCCS